MSRFFRDQKRFPRLIGIGGSLTTPLLPHHRTYGSRIRRFGGLSVLNQPAKLGSPREWKQRHGSAMTSAGLWLNLHGPWADLQVFHASSRPTPRFRSSRYLRQEDIVVDTVEKLLQIDVYHEGVSLPDMLLRLGDGLMPRTVGAKTHRPIPPVAPASGLAERTGRGPSGLQADDPLPPASV
jgi:hypothetical protein